MKYRSVVIRVDWAPDCVRATIDETKSYGLKVIDTAIDRRDSPAGKADLTMHVGFTRDNHYRAFERRLIESESIELMATRESIQ